MTSIAIRGFAATLLLLLGACGGSGSGGSANSGGTGVGATGGAATGGSGGASGGSGGTVASGGVGASASGVCAKLEPLDCFGGDCQQQVAATSEQGLVTGCKAQLAAAFDCAESDTPFCSAEVAGPQYSSTCQAAIDSYNLCLQGSGQCTRTGFVGPCAVICGSTWGAECTLKDGETSWSCFCRVGPHVGTTFNVAPVDKCSETAMAAQCAP
jgi:hypothetical protein